MSDKPVGAESQPERDQAAREVAARLGLLKEPIGIIKAYERIWDALLDKELECRQWKSAHEQREKESYEMAGLVRELTDKCRRLREALENMIAIAAEARAALKAGG